MFINIELRDTFRMNEEPILYDMEETTLYRHKSNSCHFWMKPSCFLCIRCKFIDDWHQENSLRTRSWLTLSRKNTQRQQMKVPTYFPEIQSHTKKVTKLINCNDDKSLPFILVSKQSINFHHFMSVFWPFLMYTCLVVPTWLQWSLVNQLTLISSDARVTQVNHLMHFWA